LFSIYEDRAGVLWLGSTNAGVYRFNGKAFERFRP
jgi:ligand-binding sensor domain-containing protein